MCAGSALNSSRGGFVHCHGIDESFSNNAERQPKHHFWDVDDDNRGDWLDNVNRSRRSCDGRMHTDELSLEGD